MPSRSPKYAKGDLLLLTYGAASALVKIVNLSERSYIIDVVKRLSEEADGVVSFTKSSFRLSIGLLDWPPVNHHSPQLTAFKVASEEMALLLYSSGLNTADSV